MFIVYDGLTGKFHLQGNSVTTIRVQNLRKEFRTFKRREGVWGSVRDLLQRNYTTLPAVDGISFNVEPGELIGYIGPNGAGKSTSIKMLTGILKPTSGEMEVLGFHPFRDRKSYTKNIGVVFGQRTQLWWDIAVIESLRLLGRIYEVPDKEFESRLEKLDVILGLKDLLHTPVRKLSLGQRVRCDIAASLIHQPKVLFLDEPTIGLDAVAKDSIRSFLKRLNKEFSITVILTTHDLQEIEELCHRIVILDKGKIIFDGPLTQIKALPGLRRHITVDFLGAAPAEQLNAAFNGRAQFLQESERRLVADYDPISVPTVELIRQVVGQHQVADLTIAEPTIEEVVMKIYRDGI